MWSRQRILMSTANRLEYIPVAKIRENSEALRTEVDKGAVAYQELVMSIRDEGVLLPILVREEKDPTTGDVTYPLVDGLQRFTGASEVGLETIPAQITTISDAKVIAAQVMANATRVETPPAQYAAALRKILQLEPTLTTEELGRRVGKSDGWVKGMLKLTKLEPGIQKLVDEGKLGVSNGIALAGLPADKQAEYLTAAMSEPPATFGPRMTEVIKEIRSAARQGRVVDTSFKPQATPRKSSAVKTLLNEVEAGNKTTITGLIQSNGIIDPVEAAEFMLKWYFSLDPASVAQQKAKWEQGEKEKQEAKEKRAAENAAKKLAKAKEDAAAATATA